MSDERISEMIWLGLASWRRKMLSITDSSVDVVDAPQKAAQSLAQSPAPMTSEPMLTVPATRGTCSSDDSSSMSCTVVRGWTIPPTLLNTQYDPTSALPAI